MRLLIVEDERDLASAVADHLRAQGHAVDVAGDLATAADAVAGIDYDLMLLDLHLPDGDDAAGALSAALATRTAAEWEEWARERDIPIAACAAPSKGQH